MFIRTPLLIEADLAQQRQGERGRRRVRRERNQAKKTRVLFHIAKKPAKPHPAQSQAARYTGPSGHEVDETPEGMWERPGRKPVKSGAFLTPNPSRVGSQHGVGIGSSRRRVKGTKSTKINQGGNVYAYRVPEKVIRKSGGIRTFDNATELLVPKGEWGDVDLLGKSQDKSEFTDHQGKAGMRASYGYSYRNPKASGKPQQRRDKKAQDIEKRQQGRTRKRPRRERSTGRRQQRREWSELRSPLLCEALQVRRQSSKERMAKKKPSATFGAARSSKWLWQQIRKKWSKAHPQYIFRKGRLMFVPPEKRRQLKSKIKGRVVLRAKTPGSGHKG